MFTGIVKALGTLTQRAAGGGDQRLQFAAPTLDMSAWALGDSVAVNGVCLTVIARDAHAFRADVSQETMACTTLGTLTEGTRVNLEPALRLGDALGGHLVSGHVDGRGRIMDRHEEARSVRFRVEAPAALMRYIATKGSITLDGISLTVNQVMPAFFEFNAIPHTLTATTLQYAIPGQHVNLEVDLLARYLERLSITHLPPS